jgi:UvrD-like helicase C-terminal domain
VSFDGRSVTYGLGELDMLVPAYAATIHKSQGSEYPAVIIPVLAQSTLPHVAAESSLHRRHQRQATGRVGWAEEGSCYLRV